MLREAVSAACIFFGIVGATYLLILAWKIFKAPRHIYERNRQATLLARKHNRGNVLSPAEKAALKKYVEDGILRRGMVFDGMLSTYRERFELSDNAVDLVLSG